MQLFIGNQLTKVLADDDELSWLTNYLQFEDSSNSFYMADGKAAYSGAKQRFFYNYHTKSFPSGLAALAYREALKEGFKVEIFDQRTKPATLDPSIDLEWLKERKLLDGTPFQFEAVNRCMIRTRGVLWLPTGSGKTEIAVGVCKAVPVRWIFLAPEADLMTNFADRYELRTGEPCGRIGDGMWDDDHRVVSCTFQTLARALKDDAQKVRKMLAQFQGMFVDEVHQLPANSFYEVAMNIPNAYYRFGMSGTALLRSDSRSMFIVSAMGEPIYQVSAKDLIDAQHISRPTIKFVPFATDIPKSKTYIGAYTELVTCVRRNQLIAQMAHAARKPALVFVRRDKHGLDLKKRIAKLGHNVEFVNGKWSLKRRKEAIRKLRCLELDVVICTKVWQTGTDIPELEGLVIATGGASAIESLQRVGRGTRIVRDSKGRVVKGEVEVWELYDEDPKEINPLTGRKKQSKAQWFEKHSKQRKASYEMEGYPVEVLTPLEARAHGLAV